MSKGLWIFVVAVLSCGHIAADTENRYSLCKQMSDVAGMVMENRQEGMLMSELMALADSSFSGLLEDIASAAYSKPRFSTEKMQKRAIVDFQNDVYLGCVTNLKD